jgi:hypothetical protein
VIPDSEADNLGGFEGKDDKDPNGEEPGAELYTYDHGKCTGSVTFTC